MTEQKPQRKERPPCSLATFAGHPVFSVSAYKKSLSEIMEEREKASSELYKMRQPEFDKDGNWDAMAAYRNRQKRK